MSPNQEREMFSYLENIQSLLHRLVKAQEPNHVCGLCVGELPAPKPNEIG